MSGLSGGRGVVHSHGEKENTILRVSYHRDSCLKSDKRCLLQTQRANDSPYIY